MGADWYGEEYYATLPVDDPTGPDSGDVRVIRGGAWDDFPVGARPAYRCVGEQHEFSFNIGFRVARTQ